MIFVLDFGFRQRGAVVEAPIHRLASAVDVALFHEIQERAGDRGLVFMAHGQVGIIPTAENAEALEIFLVLLDVTQGELPAHLSKIGRRHFSFSAQLFFHLRFDGQAVAIPSRHVRGVMARHALGLDHEVLEDFVQPGAEMNFAGGIGRPIVQHEQRLAFPRFQDALVDVAGIPGFELFWLVLRQAGLHGKIGFRQVQSFLQFQWFGHSDKRLKFSLFACVPPFFLPVRISYDDSGVRRETSESSVSTYVTMNGGRCQPLGSRNLSLPARILPARGYPTQEICV